ncbi:hypothetical protein EON64_09735 [archaeon]|nr:MAG: hypothetical protein EON64_09735 [archaeon]
MMNPGMLMIENTPAYGGGYGGGGYGAAGGIPDPYSQPTMGYGAGGYGGGGANAYGGYGGGGGYY